MERPRPTRTMHFEQVVGAVLLGCVFAAGPPLFMLAYFGSQFHGLSEPIALEQAQLGRNIASGHGFVTEVVTPLSVLHNPDLARHPDGSNPPLGPLLLALAFRIASPSDTAAAMVTVTLWLLVLGVTWLFAWRAFGPGVSALAPIIVGVNTTMLITATSATPRMLATLLCTVLLYAMYELGGRESEAKPLGSTSPSRLPAVLWGLIFGLACLTTPLACLLLPGIALCIWLRSEDRRGQIIACLVAALAVASPWLLRNTIVFHNPLFSLRWYDLVMYTRSYPADSLLQTYAPPPAPLIFCLTHPGEFIAKFITALGGLRDALFTTSDFYVAAVFIVGAFVRVGDARLERVRVAAYVMIAFTAIGVAATRPDTSAFVPFVPFVSLIASAVFLQQLWRLHLHFHINPYRRMRQDVMRWAIIMLALVLLIYPLGMTFQRAKWTRPPPRQPLAAAEGRTPEGEPVMTNIPWDVAWHLDRTGVLAPPTFAEFQQMQAATGRIDYVVLGAPLRPSPRGELDLFWLALADPAPQYTQGYWLLGSFEIREGLRAVIRSRVPRQE